MTTNILEELGNVGNHIPEYMASHPEDHSFNGFNMP
jgi:hypothetical protein